MKRDSESISTSPRQSPPGSLCVTLAILIVHGLCGCTLITNGTHVLLTDPLHFPNNLNHLTTRHRHRRIARAYLNEFRCANPGFRLSDEYTEGFVDGFVDYVTYGGRPAPPTLPPRRYWKKWYTTSEGHAAVQEWFSGFADGSLEAAHSGLRELQLVPSSLLVGSFGSVIEDESWSTVPPDVESWPEEALPAPRAEPFDRLNEPANSVIPEVDILLDPMDPSMRQQGRSRGETGGALRQAGYAGEQLQPADRALWQTSDDVPRAGARRALHEAEEPVRRAPQRVQSVSGDGQSEVMRLPAVNTNLGEPALLKPDTSDPQR